MSKPDKLLWLNDARGVYIPRDFATSFVNRAKNVTGVSDENWAILEAGPHDNEHYWDTWDDVLNNAVVVSEGATIVKYRLHQEGDLWLIPEGMEWDDTIEGFRWPDEDEEVIDSSNCDRGEPDLI
jgi:hypothetical protein